MPPTTNAEIVELDGKIQRTLDGIEAVKDKQDEMAVDIRQIKEAVYNPDEGIYARLRELESWKSTQSRFMWIVTTGVLGLMFYAIKNSFLTP